MEEEEGEVCSTPFWVQSSTNRRRDRIRRLSSLFLNSGLLIFLLCLTAFMFAFFVIPSIVSSASQILRPTALVKKSWDSVNTLLVLFALVVGFLSRNRNREYDESHRINVPSSPVGLEIRSEIQKSNPSTPRQRWYEYDDRTVYNSTSSAVNGGGALRRNSCSYPDLRDASPWVNADDRWRFSDDLLVEAHRHSDSDQFRRRRSWKRVFEEEEEQQQQQAAPATRVEEDSYTPPPLPSPPPPATTVHRKPTRAYESVARREQVKGSEPAITVAPPAATLPVPPPAQVDSEKKSSKSGRKRSGANATKDLFTSIYNQKSNNRKKKQRQKSVDNFETLIQPQAPSPPPPPSPTPPSALRNLLSSQKGKSKKIVTVPPPSTTARASKSTAIVPLKTSDFVGGEENSNSGGESTLTGCDSPLIPIPPPPPPPPFKMPSWRFVVRGDYVKVGSMDSSRSGSPAITPTAGNGGGAAGQLFCPSPDVDTKADMFIAKFRAGLKLQKMNSMARQKHGLGLSNLGPDGKPGPGPSLI